MTLRAPLLSSDAVPNRFGWRHEGPGPQLIADDTPMDGELLPAAAFDHPALQRRPPYVPERLGLPTFSFALRKSCAGLAYEYRRDPEGIYERIMGKALVAEDGAALRWMLSGLQFPTQFVRLHTCGRLTIEELAYMARSAFGNRGAYRTWLNQWGRSPERALPSLPGSILLERPDELSDSTCATCRPETTDESTGTERPTSSSTGTSIGSLPTSSSPKRPTWTFPEARTARERDAGA